jgi:8-oxo-dGTP pyrophosphatase MutT (NUDIX family)
MAIRPASTEYRMFEGLTVDDIRKAVGSRTPLGLPDEKSRRASVLVPFVRVDGVWHLLLTRRTEDLEHHKGQVAFPGGAEEDGETREQTALREAFEEIGLAEEKVELIGRLDDMRTPTGFVITPVTGFVSSIDELRANPDEVSRVFTVPLDLFADPRNAEMKEMTLDRKVREVWFYRYDAETIWGATALIIRSVIEMLREESETEGRSDGVVE